MMNLIRLDDELDNGGKVIDASETMKFEGRRVARKGDKVRCEKHLGFVPNVIEEGDETMCDEGIPIARHLHKTTCGCHVITSLV
ncbi:PAAR domain-containing protein [Paraburkholderia guartelaensis]|uniref:PAAR domain-containing protein n=1 Tax=Paraburkholderia guartelaensis TaxID=2546446 RepID=UPI002AB6F8E8|nr:PAAR domain-containing protein [Paraburkholderia guartelaensis]